MSILNIIMILDSLSVAHESILAVMEEKKQAIISNNIEDVLKAGNKEFKLIKQISELDDQRIQSITDYMKASGLRATSSPTVSDLMRATTKLEEKQKLREAQERLLGVLAEVKNRNDLNQQLIRQSLGFINFSLDIIAGAPEQDATYHPMMQQGTVHARRTMFDTRG